MATTRKRSNPAGFASQEEETLVNEFLEEAFEEVEKQEQMPVVLHIAEPEPEPEIEPPSKPAPVAVKPAPSLSPPPKRHPRNIPKFSSHK
jgi:hypothetical protein